MKLQQIILLILLVNLLTACAVSGRAVYKRPFTPPSSDITALGETTSSRVNLVMGKPDISQWLVPHGKRVKVYAYVYGKSEMNRQATFYFLDEILVGYGYESSFPEDSTYFDVKNIKGIVENKSYRRDVELTLGKPNGEAIFPLLDDPEGRVLWYRYFGSKGDKIANFQFDRNGILRHFDVNLSPSSKPWHVKLQSLGAPSCVQDLPLCDSIIITKVEGGKESDWRGHNVRNKDLHDALQAMLSEYGYLSVSSTDAPFRLEVFLVELKRPSSGYTMTAGSFIRYKLYRNSDNKLMYDDLVSTDYSATKHDTYFGSERQQLANEGAIWNNIVIFLGKLNNLNTTKSSAH